MKKIALSFFVFIFTIMFAAAAFATEIPDALRAAQVFAGMNINSCDGTLGFSRVEDDISTWISGDITLQKEDDRYSVTYLAINDVVIVDVSQGDEPLYGIPQNAVGIARDYNVNIWCYETGSNNQVAYGYFYTPILEVGEPIIITLEAAVEMTIIEFAAPEGVDPNNLYLEDSNGARYMYDYYYGGFAVYVNPAEITDYWIMDYDGNTYGNGTIDPLSDPNPGSGESMMNVRLPEGVNEVVFNEYNYWWAERQQLNGFTVVGDVEIPAEAYYMDMQEKGGSLSVYGITDVEVKVMSYREKGEMPEIDISDNNCTYSPEDFCANIPAGYNKVVVLVTGGAVGENGYYISFSKRN
jgi:hypothetical protein